MYGSKYKSVVQCTKGVYQNEGLRAFYRSYTTQLVMNLPHQALHFTTYEFFQNLVSYIIYIFFITCILYFIITSQPVNSFVTHSDDQGYKDTKGSCESYIPEVKKTFSRAY